MYFRDSIQVLVRRWYFVLSGVLLIAAAAGAALVVVPTTYQATGQMLLLQSANATEKPSNPYLNLQPGLAITASLIAGSVTSKDTQTELVDAGYSEEYSIALAPSAGPLLVISVEDTDPERALATRNELLTRLDAELERIQIEESVPAGQLIHTRTDSVLTQAEVLPGSKIRALAVIGAVGLLLTLVVTFALDRMLTARSRRRGTVGDTETDSTTNRSLVPVVPDSEHRSSRRARRHAASSVEPSSEAVAASSGGSANPSDDRDDVGSARRRGTRLELRSRAPVRVGANPRAVPGTRDGE